MTTPISQQHRAWSDNFSRLVSGTSDWDVPTPVAEWTARDVIRHLVEWPPAMLGSMGSTWQFPDLPSVDDDPVGAWTAHDTAMQSLLDDPDASAQVLETPMTGAARTDEVLARFYLPDVFMHAWDLARATGQDDGLDEAACAQMHEGMRSIEPMLRESGQFGEQQPVTDDASPTEKFMAFIGRRPDWQPPA